MKYGPVILGLLALLNLYECTNSQRTSSSHRIDVYIAGFFPFGEGVENSQTGRGVMPSVKLALDHVNEHANILKNYRLHMWWNDTECNAAVGVKSFFDMMHSGPQKLMLFGAACTHVTDPIAKASRHWHLTQLSYADTHPMFTKDAFPNFFRIVPSENAFNAPRLALLKQFNWTRVGTIYQNEPRYSLPHNHMVADLDSMGMEVVETQSIASDVREPLKKLRDKDVRIILANFNEHWARKVFCEAFKLDMYGRAYQWLIMGTYSTDWWNISTDCSQEELSAALETVISTDLLPLSTSGDITVSGITADEYLTEYDKRRGSEYSRFHGYTYDGIWAVALAIQYVSQRKDQFLNNFQYRVKEWENIFLEALRNTSFEGVTGPVRFYNNERRAGILLKQFQFGDEVKIGEYNSLHSHLDLSLGVPMKWFGRSPPKDRTLLVIEHSQVNITIYIILASFSALGIIMAIIFLGVNIKFRNQRYIKMSSPHLNNLIIIGCMLTYLSVIFLGLDSGLSSIAAFPYICTARAWLLMAGFSLAFGAMFSKTWRVHSIFTDLKLNKKVIKDYQLFMVVGVLLAIDFAIMTTWQLADPFYRDTKQMEPYPHPSLEDVLLVHENEYCQSEKMTIFVGVIYAYKGLLLVFGAFLAWETRHVSIPALNDSKHIGLSVYNVLIMCIMGAAITLVLSDRKDAVFILISVFIIFCTTGTLCLVFIPKLVELKRNPNGSVDKRIRATLRPMSKNGRDSNGSEMEQKMRELKTNNCRFRKALIEREAELQTLIRKLGPDAHTWLDGSGVEIVETHKDQSRLSVPPVRRDFPSTTETVTDMTSVGSVTSTHAEIIDHQTPTCRSAMAIAVAAVAATNPCATTVAATKRKSMVASCEQTHNTIMSVEKTTLASTKPINDNVLKQTVAVMTPKQHHHSAIECVATAAGMASGAVADSMRSWHATPEHGPTLTTAATCEVETRVEYNVPKRKSPRHTDHDNKANSVVKYNTQMNATNSLAHSNLDLSSVCPHGHGSTKNLSTDARRISVQLSAGGGTTATATTKGNYVVSQSDLWDTHTLSHGKQQHVRQSPRNCQRSVSEKNRTKHRHKVKTPLCQSETDSERERDHDREAPLSVALVGDQKHTTTTGSGGGGGGGSTGSGSGGHHSKKLGKSMQHVSHHHSSPNVVGSEKRKHHRTRTESALIFGASSESELLDGDTAILPIFRKLLTEREPRGARSNVVGASCPNISIKCDIVEYL